MSAEAAPGRSDGPQLPLRIHDAFLGHLNALEMCIDRGEVATVAQDDHVAVDWPLARKENEASQSGMDWCARRHNDIDAVVHASIPHPEAIRQPPGDRPREPRHCGHSRLAFHPPAPEKRPELATLQPSAVGFARERAPACAQLNRQPPHLTALLPRLRQAAMRYAHTATVSRAYCRASQTNSCSFARTPSVGPRRAGHGSASIPCRRDSSTMRKRWNGELTARTLRNVPPASAFRDSRVARVVTPSSSRMRADAGTPWARRRSAITRGSETPPLVPPEQTTTGANPCWYSVAPRIARSRSVTLGPSSRTAAPNTTTASAGSSRWIRAACQIRRNVTTPAPHNISATKAT